MDERKGGTDGWRPVGGCSQNPGEQHESPSMDIQVRELSSRNDRPRVYGRRKKHVSGLGTAEKPERWQ